MIKLSILIPTYNYKKGLIDILESLISCKKEDLNDIEVIIGDDSSEKIISLKELENYRKYITNLKYIDNSKNGFFNNWNNLISESNGKYYWLLCHDEILNNAKYSLKKILNNLDKNKSLYIIPIIKVYKFNLFKRIKIYLRMRHTCNNSFLAFFIINNIFLLFLNVIGPPSAMIVDKRINVRYRNDLKWLIDVDYYFKLFNYIKNFKNIKVFSKYDASVLSNQSFSYSITNILKKDNKAFKKLKDLELLLILQNMKKIYIYRFLTAPLWIIFKLYAILNIKLKIII